MTGIAAFADPAITPRLVLGLDPLDLAAERTLGAYAPADIESLVDALAAADLKGRGGAGFPAHVKWRAVAQARGRSVVVANGEEGEPASLKDRWLLTHRPHAVLDGLLLAADAVGAARIIVYLSHEDTVRSVRSALADLKAAGLAARAEAVEVFVTRPTYVAGEESAACRAISGGPALPLAKPPRVFESGVDGAPTLVANVETLAHAAWIARHGATAYREQGVDDCPGTALVTLGGACARPGVYEVPYGLKLSDAYARLAGGVNAPVAAFLAGGWFGGVLPGEALGTPLTYEAFRALGSGLGCGAFTVLTAACDPLAVIADVARWYARETAGQCGVCVKGTQAIAEALEQVRDGQGSAATLGNLRRWGTSLGGRGACAFLDGAAALARSAVDTVIEKTLEFNQ